MIVRIHLTLFDATAESKSRSLYYGEFSHELPDDTNLGDYAEGQVWAELHVEGSEHTYQQILVPSHNGDE